MNTPKPKPGGCCFPPSCSACVTVEYLCEDCGEFEVIKSCSTLTQFCGCGKEAKPTRIINAAIKQDKKWIMQSLPNATLSHEEGGKEQQ